MAKIDDLLKRIEPEMAAAFRDAVAEVVDNVILRQVVEAIERNDLDAAWRALGVDPPVFNPIRAMFVAAMQDFGAMFMAGMPQFITDATGMKRRLRFNVRDPRAETWIANQSGSLITSIEADMRSTVQTTLQSGLAAGRNPRGVALDVVGRINQQTGKREGGVLGLSEQGETWSRNTRQKLETLDEGYFKLKLRDKRFDPIVRRAIDTGKPLSPDDVTRLVDRYRANSLRHRGEQIARAEMHEAMMRSEWLANMQAIETGNLSYSAVTKVWDAITDGHERHSHHEMDGQEVGIDEPFVSPVTGDRMMHPGDTSLGASARETVGCRCRVRYKTDWFAGVT